MILKLYAHPFSSYCQKALIAFYENDIAFEFCMLAPDDDEVMAELEALVDDGRTVPEASIIIEHLQVRHPGPVRLIPEDPRAAPLRRALHRPLLRQLCLDAADEDRARQHA
jgi:glutathione S-transferase